jgi:hypothetical protein
VLRPEEQVTHEVDRRFEGWSSRSRGRRCAALLACIGLGVLCGLLAAGCGSESGSTGDTGTAPTAHDFTARFVERTDHDWNGKQWRETVRGAFDWTAHEGWVEIQSRLPGSTLRIVQAGGSCFVRADHARWKLEPGRIRRTRNLMDVPDPKGLCDPEFLGPRSELESLRAILPDAVELVGNEEVAGVRTTHYSLYVSEIPDNEQIDLWVDESGVARRKRIDYRDTHSHNRFVTTRAYDDFGAEVKVTPPALETSN